MRLGVALPQYEIDVERGSDVWLSMLHIARRAESAGLDSVWLSDHPFAISPDGVPSGALEPFTTIAALARATEWLGIGTLVIAASMRAPAMVAHSFATVSGGAPGRIVAGVGAGWYPAEHRALGVRLPGYAERVSRVERTLEMLDALGESRPGLLCGGVGASILAVTARRADAHNVAWDVTPGDFAALGARLDEACRRAGRQPREVSRSVGLTVAVAQDERGLDRAVERLRGRAAFLKTLDHRSLAERIVWGTPEECAQRIAAYAADEVVVSLLLRDDPEMLELFAAEVAPRVRAAG